MKRILLKAIVLVVLMTSALYSADSTTTREYRKLSQSAFGTGEKFSFEVNYGFVTAGNAIMEILPSLANINGRNCYDINVNVNSSGSFEWVYKFEERYKCYLDAEGLFPWKSEQHIRETNYKRDFEAIYDHDSLRVRTYTGEREPKKFEGEFKIEMYTQDAISAFYFARTLDYSKMNNGDVIPIQSFYKDNAYPLNVKYLGKENADVPAGEFRCIMLQPMVKEGVLSSKADDIIVWVTDDDRRMPVKVQMSIIIGSIKVELSSYSGLAGPLNSKIK